MHTLNKLNKLRVLKAPASDWLECIHENPTSGHLKQL